MDVLFMIGLLLSSFVFWASVTLALAYMYPTVSGVVATVLFMMGFLGTAMIGISVIGKHDKKE